MSPKDKKFLIFASLSALSLSILAIASNEGNGFLATETTTYQCAEIYFGTQEYTSSNGSLSTTSFSTTNVNVSDVTPTASYCYKTNASNSTKYAARIGGASTAGTLAFTLSSSYAISDVWAYASLYSVDSGETGTLSFSTNSFSGSSQNITSTTSPTNLSSTDPSVLSGAGVFHWSGVGGISSTSSSLTFTGAAGKRINLYKVVLKIVTGSTPAAKTLTGISVTTNPTKTSYTSGEALDTTGLVVTADYDDSSSADVTSSCTLSPANGTTLSTVGTQKVSVSYTYSGVTKTASFSVIVTSASVTLSSIAVTTNPDLMTYTVGDSLDTNGIVVTATYSDQSTADVTSSCSFSPTTLSSAGTQRITVTFSDQTTTFDVTVAAAKTLSSLASTGTLTTTSYTAGQSFNPAGLTVTATYSDGSTANVTSSVTWGSLSQGDTSVTGSYAYGGVTKTVIITGITVSASSGITYMYTKQAGDHLQVFALEQTGTYGDCTLFKYGNWEMLIDGGNTTSGTQLTHFMTTYVTDHTLDLLVLTHPHTDHYGGFYDTTTAASSGGTLADGGITNVSYIVDSGMDSYGSGYTTNWINGIRSHYVGLGASYSTIESVVSGHMYDAIWHITPDIYIQWLDSGTYSAAQSNANNNSVCLNAHFGTNEFVMVGDAQNVEVADLLANYPAATHKFVTDTDNVVFKACHHCSGTSDSGNTTEFINYLSPDYGWASAGILSTNGAGQNGCKTNSATPTNIQHPYKNGATSITNKTGKANFYWNGASGTLDMTLNESFGGFSIVGEGRVYGYGYNIGGTLVDVNSEKTTPLFSTQWATTTAFGDGSGGTL